MEEKSLGKMHSSEVKQVYLKRRVYLIGAIMLLLILLAIIVITSSAGPPSQEPPADNAFDPTSSPIYERPPILPALPPAVVNDTEPEEECILAPIEALGCLELNEGQNIFEAKGLNLDDKTVKNLIKKVEADCDTDNADGVVDRDCIVDAVVYNSENSWVCDWACLRDLASCETYKMHLAVSIARKYVPATDIFVVRTNNFHFFLIYKDNQDKWIQKFSFGLSKPVPEALYNDVYHAGPITEVVFPQILEVEVGDKFCFDVYADRSCACSIEVLPFTVGECPQLPADLKGICDAPVKEVYLNTGVNSICFTVADNATEEFYTYNFALTSGENYIPAGDAFMKYKEWDCCVNDSFKGFLSIQN